MELQKRDDRFDTLKGVLIFLVVTGHVMTHVEFIHSPRTISDYFIPTLFSFHMPAFVFISGYFSGKWDASPEYYKKLVSSLLLPFVIFHLLSFALFSRNLTTLLTPRWTTWYLLSLFFWKLLFHPVSRLKWPLAWALALGLYVGMTKASTFLSISRIICFFPFFIAGYYMRQEHFEKLRRHRLAALLVMLAALTIVVFMIYRGLPVKHSFQMHMSYKSLNLTFPKGILLRLSCYIISFALLFALLSLVPAGRSIFTLWGRNSITIYLAHPIVILGCQRILNACSVHFSTSEPVLFLIVLALSAMICLAFGNRYVVGAYKALIGRISRLILK